LIFFFRGATVGCFLRICEVNGVSKEDGRTREQFPAEIVPKVPRKYRRLMQYGRIGMLWFIGGDNPQELSQGFSFTIVFTK